jgi:hypothetical protein
MEKILAKRYAFCDFSDIVGFPHPVPTIIEWDDYLPRFRGSKDDHPGEHLFNFHKCMLEHGFVHEDVLIKLFKFSLEEKAREWCQSLPAVSIHSLKDFHVAFNSYYEKIYSADLIFDNCCKESAFHIQHSVSIPSDCEEVEQIDEFASDSVRSAEIEEDSLQFPDLHGLSNLQLEHVNHDPGCIESATHVMGSPHFSDLKTKANCSTYEETDGGEELNSPDQQSIVYVSPTNLEQPAFNKVISKGSFQDLFNLQLEQQFKEVFLSDFYDPVDNYFQSISSKYVKAFGSEEDCPYQLFKPLYYMMWLPLLFGSRSRKLSINHLLTWLHWKHEFT